MRRRIAWIVGSKAMHRFATFAVPLFVTPLALKRLGPDAYGAWVLAGALGTYFSFTFGIPQFLVDVTAAGVAESHPHDVAITKESPNYVLEHRDE